MGPEMAADTNVKNELNSINSRLDHHDKTLDKLANVTETLVLVVERQSNFDEKIRDISGTIKENHTEAMDAIKETNKSAQEGIKENRTIILKWSGAISAVILIVTLGLSMYKALGGG